MHVVSTNYNIFLVTYQTFLSKAERFGLEMNTESYSKFGNPLENIMWLKPDPFNEILEVKY